MEQKKDLTRLLIEDSFKELMRTHPFEKITIKMIADRAGIIRPTFYNHFRDKYDLVEGIFEEEIMNGVRKLAEEKDRGTQAICFLFEGIHQERSFYRKVFLLTGQNCFEEVMRRQIYDLFYSLFQRGDFKNLPKNPVLNAENIALYFTFGLVDSVKTWLMNTPEQVTVDELVEAYYFLVTHSIFELY